MAGWKAEEGGVEQGLAVEEDPRPYVHALRKFAAGKMGKGVALVEASRLWGRLWRQGIPWTTLLLNNINHPNREGLRLFVDALLPLFPSA